MGVAVAIRSFILTQHAGHLVYGYLLGASVCQGNVVQAPRVIYLVLPRTALVFIVPQRTHAGGTGVVLGNQEEAAADRQSIVGIGFLTGGHVGQELFIAVYICYSQFKLGIVKRFIDRLRFSVVAKGIIPFCQTESGNQLVCSGSRTGQLAVKDICLIYSVDRVVMNLRRIVVRHSSSRRIRLSNCLAGDSHGVVLSVSAEEGIFKVGVNLHTAVGTHVLLDQNEHPVFIDVHHDIREELAVNLVAGWICGGTCGVGVHIVPRRTRGELNISIGISLTVRAYPEVIQ